MCNRHLKLNISKTELLIFSPNGVTSFFPIFIDGTSFLPVAKARTLVLILSSISLRTHVWTARKSCWLCFQNISKFNMCYHLLCCHFCPKHCPHPSLWWVQSLYNCIPLLLTYPYVCSQYSGLKSHFKTISQVMELFYSKYHSESSFYQALAT